MQICESSPIVPNRLGGRNRQRSACNLSRGSNHKSLSDSCRPRKAHTYDLRDVRTVRISLDMASPLAIHLPRTICPPPDRVHAICAHFRLSDAPRILQTTFLRSSFFLQLQYIEYTVHIYILFATAPYCSGN